METTEDRQELETLLDIVINQIPSYTNMGCVETINFHNMINQIP
ncbi:MAG: hypothetical protein ACE5GR_00620 [Nitrosopumilus sp.]